MNAVTAPNLELRPMMRNDVSRVMEVEPRAYPFSWTEAIFQDCLRVGYSCWVLEDAKTSHLIGYGVMSMAVGECHVLNLTVRPEMQGRGFGRHLLRCFLEVARKRHVETVFLEVRPTNAPALELYRTEGFNEVGLRRGYYPAIHGREDALVMARHLK